MILTERQLEFGRLLIQGLSDDEIAKRMGISTSAVKKIMQRLIHNARIFDGMVRIKLAVQFYHYFRLTQ